MPSNKQSESEKPTASPGHGESINQDALTPEVVDAPPKKKSRYSKSRKGIGGRPNHDHIFQRPAVQNFIQYLVRRDASDSEIARQINVPLTSFQRWKKKNSEFWLKADTTDASDLEKVKRSLIERATGFWVERPVYDKLGQLKGTKFQYYPPSDTAIQYYLNNRDPQNWKSKVEHNHALEELPVAINFVEAIEPKKEKALKAITDDFGNTIMISDDEKQGSSKS
jgi:hypothetical protein